MADYMHTFRSSSCNFANEETSWISESRREALPLPAAGPWAEF